MDWLVIIGRVFLVIAAIGAVFFGVIFLTMLIMFVRDSHLRVETYTDLAIVFDKHAKLYKDDIYNKYFVDVQYGGRKFSFDDEDYYNEFDVGDTIRVVVYRGYNKKGVQKFFDIDLPDLYRKPKAVSKEEPPQTDETPT